MRGPVRGREAVGALLDALAGEWVGHGRGEYPTLDAFDYRESLRIERHETDPLVRYDQRTWRAGADGETPSHWETGFLRFLGKGRIDIADAQSGGRAERLTGTAWVEEGVDGPTWELELAADAYPGDLMMRASERRWRLHGDALEYEMRMATSRVPELQLHLRCHLTRG